MAEFKIKRRWVSVETHTIEADSLEAAIEKVEQGDYDPDETDAELWEGNCEVFQEDEDPEVDRINELREQFAKGEPNFGEDAAPPTNLEVLAWRKGAKDALDKV